jgi:glucosamine-6-phosphate deaminase
MSKPWTFQPAEFIPFRDVKAIERVIRIPRKDLARHPNKRFRITIMPDAEVGFRWVTDMFCRIWRAAEEGRKIVLITPNPARSYAEVARLLNHFRVNCRHVHTFNMDEYANEEGRTPPETWPLSFMYAFKTFFYKTLDPKLRPPEKQIRGPTSANVGDYGKMIADMGGADICYSGPGWTGHLAFIEPDAPEFQASSLKEFLSMGPRICRLSPFTIAQNSLHGFFGASGNLCAVPPRAATIGPAEVVGARHRIDMHSLTTAGTFVSWQRLVTRLCLHGPVTPRVPTSILQLLRTDVWVSEAAAADIRPRWEMEY